eukprot:TRINITY_DN5073_c0_g1_i2.p1 TRINITY_DN5073_c0_g1~~TRINITY_DN5073_c0_g1_i2.p1  ORF type:complete len:224 (-),score=48.35 TRINITY_DN5073_c0_g1_i2:6-677(-)
MMAKLEHSLGAGALHAIHLNDCKAALGSHLDRHDNIGEGSLGLVPFWCLMNDKRTQSIPMVLETPPQKSNTTDGYRSEIELLYSLEGAGCPSTTKRKPALSTKKGQKVRGKKSKSGSGESERYSDSESESTDELDNETKRKGKKVITKSKAKKSDKHDQKKQKRSKSKKSESSDSEESDEENGKSKRKTKQAKRKRSKKAGSSSAEESDSTPVKRLHKKRKST